MGKGGTRFIGDAISSRVGKRCAVTPKDMRKNMDKFLETGRHPDLEWAKKERAIKIPPLPEFDPVRPFVFFDISVGNKVAGRLVIELFTDVAPTAANHFQSRCLPGSTGGLSQSIFHKLLPGYAIFGGKDASGASSLRLPHCGQLRSLERGCVSASEQGDEIAVSLGRALELDFTHQVVGRVVPSTLKVLDAFDSLTTLPDDSPMDRVSITKCGRTNHLGVYEDLDSDPSATMTPEERAAAEAKQREESRAAVMQAVEATLSAKRRAASDAGPNASGSSLTVNSANKKFKATAPTTPSAGKGQSRGALDILLGGDCSSSESSSSEDDGESDVDDKEQLAK